MKTIMSSPFTLHPTKRYGYVHFLLAGLLCAGVSLSCGIDNARSSVQSLDTQVSGLPNKSIFPAGPQLPIDGTWALRPYNTNGFAEAVEIFTVQVEGSRAFYVNSLAYADGTILLADLTQIDGSHFAASRLFPNPGGSYRISSRLTIESSTQLLEHVDSPPIGSASDWQWDEVSLVDKKALDASLNAAATATGSVTVLRLDGTGDERVPSVSQEARVDPGAKVTVTRSRTIQHSVSLDTTKSVESELSIPILDIIKADIRGKIEQEEGETFSDTSTYTASVELDGNVGTRWRLVWYDHLTVGTAKLSGVGDKVYDLPYKFPIGTDLDALRED
jgi:hypothetical protein